MFKSKKSSSDLDCFLRKYLGNFSYGPPCRSHTAFIEIIIIKDNNRRTLWRRVRECYNNIHKTLAKNLWFFFILYHIVWPRKLVHSSFSSSVHSLLPKDNLFKNIFDFTTAGDWDCVAAKERLPALHYSVNFIFLSFRIMGFIWELWNY